MFCDMAGLMFCVVASRYVLVPRVSPLGNTTRAAKGKKDKEDEDDEEDESTRTALVVSRNVCSSCVSEWHRQQL